MTSRRQAAEMGLALLLGVVVTAVLAPFFPRIASTAGGVLAATYFFSRYPWGGREGINEDLDALIDRYVR